ncbi:hypothetical protein [Alicyclobacillus fastidiosus]|uniref:Copper amine oxidase-like N-terminal domain-containing protein n=1 Tax=Alicyclobacillus fastidiosus TaxID=392011 RepID=A0ABV5AKQ3_9BACL|nr:hypothetical protein [Alicyclobacillus fastidiosus]WEH09247.1 hypothetical protein PYS47_21660 [Alicyclobacillus fastidiosus]
MKFTKMARKVPTHVAAFLAGGILFGGSVFAATNMVQAQKGNSTFTLNGQTVGNASKLVYGGTTYVQLYSIEQALDKAGVTATWNGSKNPGVFSMKTAAGATTPSSTTVDMSQLPKTFTYKDGEKLTINSVTADNTSTVINVTVSNVGSETDAMVPTGTLSDNGPVVEWQGDTLDETDTVDPGQSTTGNITFGPLQPGATNFTWYFYDFDIDQESITFNLAQ